MKKTKSCFFVRINKIDKSSSQTSEMKGEGSKSEKRKEML